MVRAGRLRHLDRCSRVMHSSVWAGSQFPLAAPASVGRPAPRFSCLGCLRVALGFRFSSTRTRSPIPHPNSSSEHVAKIDLSAGGVGRGVFPRRGLCALGRRGRRAGASAVIVFVAPRTAGPHGWGCPATDPAIRYGGRAHDSPRARRRGAASLQLKGPRLPAR